MRKNLIAYIMLLSLFGSEIAFAENIVMQKNETQIIDSIEKNIVSDKNSLLNFFEDVHYLSNKENTHSINEEMYQAKMEALNDANASLFEKDFSIKKNNKKMFDGVIKGNDLLENKNTVKGYINETIILSLDDCIKKALENNPQIRSAMTSSEISKLQISKAWTNYFPKFNMTNGYTKNRFLSLNFSVPQKVYDYYNAVTFNTSLLLFDFGKTKSNVDIAKNNYDASKANLNEVINTTVFNVKSAYYILLQALERQDIYKDSVDSYALQLKQAQSFYRIGTKPKIDVVMAQYNLGNAQLGFIKATNDITLAVAQLNNAMGLSQNDTYKVLDKLIVKKYDYSFNELIAEAYSSRPELLLYKKQVKAAELAIRSSKRAFYPNLEAVGMYQVGGGAKFSDDYGWKIGAQFTYGDTNLLLLKKNVDEAKLNYKKNLADLDSIEQKLYLDVKQAYINMKNANESIPVTALSLQQAKEQYRLASGRYRTGYGDAIELKDSEVAYRNARLDYLSALLQYNISVADLERVVGFKLQEANIEE